MNLLQPSWWTASTSTSNQVVVGGANYWVQDAARTWSFTNPSGDNSSLRFEVQAGDKWSGDGTSSVERSEIAGATTYAQGTNLHVAYNFAMEPGATNDASWMVVGQFHHTNLTGSWSPPFEIGLVGDRMTIQVDEAGTAANSWSAYKTIYTDTQNIVRGHNYAIQIDADFDPTNGHLTVVRDGVTLVNYNGPLGWSDMGSVYWKEGIYRSAAASTQAADYGNLSITTGTSTSPPPPPAAPDTVQGGDGADTITGDTMAAKRLLGGAGDDVITSQGASDTINGNTGADTIHGGAGRDVISGGKDNDILFADTGSDTVNGNLGADTIHGGDGDCVLRGGADNDVVIGGAGNDQIWGDRGVNSATGGAGGDTFHISAGAGVTLVTDFHPFEGDRVRIDDGAHYVATQSGADVLVDLGGGSQVILQNTDLGSLQPGWIF